MPWFHFGRKTLGQITLDSSIGKWLAILASDSEVKAIVEIGAWHGGGSTDIISRAVRNRRDVNVHAWCLEAHRQRAREAASRHADNPSISVLWGVVVAPNELDSWNLSDEEQVWFSEDLQWICSAPHVLDKLPDEIDLLLLDGGEFSTYAEFANLSSRLTRWLIIDDVETRKCANLFRDLTSASGSNFDLIWQSRERNGTAVFRRRSSY